MPTYFPRIGIIGKFGDPGIAATLNELYRYLKNRGHSMVIDHQSAEFIEDDNTISSAIDALPAHCDLIIAVGGDGTFLSAARVVRFFPILQNHGQSVGLFAGGAAGAPE